MITLKINRASLTHYIEINGSAYQNGDAYLSIDERFSFGQFVCVAPGETLEKAYADGALLIPLPAMSPERNARFGEFCNRFKPPGCPERNISTKIVEYLAWVSREPKETDAVVRDAPRWPDACEAWEAAEREDKEGFIIEWCESLHCGAEFWKDSVRIHGTDSDYVASLYGDRLLPSKMVKAKIPAVTIEFPELVEELADLAFPDMPQARWWTLTGAADTLGVADNVIGNRIGRVTRIHQHLQGAKYAVTWNDNKSAFHIRLKDKEAFMKAFGGLQFREDAWD